MQTWFAMVRGWFDWEGADHESLWSPFGVDERTGHPCRFTGSEDDALDQLEAEVKWSITPSTRVRRRPGRLLLSTHDDESDGSVHVEYRLVELSGPVPGGQAGPGPAARPDAGRFLEEFDEVAADVAMDYRVTMRDLDEEVGRRVNDYLIEMIRIADGDAPETIRHLMSGMLWMFMLGREHAIRGYPSPVPRRSDPADSWVPDTIAGLDEE